MHYIAALADTELQLWQWWQTGGPYVSADDIPEQAEIHLLDSTGGDFTVQQRRSALPGSS